MEHVTVIPKTSCPADFSGLRNISCTLLASKMYESYVLEWLSSKVSLKRNQYGGVRGCSTAHMLVQLYQNICENLEDYRAATLLTAIDYSKAFNRMSYQHCLRSLAKMGATLGLLRIVASFLTGRMMTVRVGKEWSVPREVTGGCPQGSILGVFLFNATIDDLEDTYLGGRDPSDSSDTPSDNDQEDTPLLGTAMSTPARPGDAGIGDPGDSPVRVSRAFRFLPEINEARRRIRLERHSSDDEELPPEPAPVTQAKWKHSPIDLLKYVDDNVSAEKINMETADRMQLETEHRDKHAVQTQNLFRTVLRAAEFKGMKINHSKTGILVISDAMSYVPRAHFYDSSGERLQNKPGEDSLKCLGFHISCLLYTSPSPRDRQKSRMPSSA